MRNSQGRSGKQSDRSLSPIEQYLDHLDDLCAKKGRYHLITKEDERPPVWSILYQNVPDRGDLTAFLYGLSSVNHPAWTKSRVELAINVQSNNVDWGIAIGFLARMYRGKAPF